ncbi:DUF3352 domain-containing protein [Stieleria sp. TO1_6]|uniref:DUF3352 domain-containing protein n=1 Tax=Stieleria tagensis TaxID=2956795 RepID=UPI00209A9B18|nr:DUF3352 domain-containing protein [Stieleria tagensis]MCO8124372.1 DUF3352 domain-containing protein [Stieleria tagensis]
MTSHVSRYRFRLANRVAAAALLYCTLAVPASLCSSQAADPETSESSLPGAPRLLPSDTLAYLRLDSAEDFRSEMGQSSLGRMINDPKMRPFADQFYATARELFDRISDEVGVGLDELLSIPHGQVAIAVHPAKPLDEDDKPEIDNEDDDPDQAAKRRDRLRRREAYSFGGTLIVDAGKQIDQAMAIVERLEERIVSSGYKRRVRKIEKTDVIRLIPNRADRTAIEYFEKDGTLVFAVGNRSAQDVLEHWLGENEEPTLADNSKFGTIISRCIGAESTRPQITFFIDPHSIIDRIIKRSGSLTAGLTWPVIQEMGASRIGGIGGSSFHGGEIFEGIAHYHINIEPPRDGVLGVLRPETGETAPPKWVPQSIAGYTSIHWDFAKTYENAGKVLDRFQGEESLKRFVEEPAEKRLGLNIQSDVLENLTGRLVRCTWMEPPIRINSGVTTVAFEVKDVIKAKSTLASVRDRMPGRMTLETTGGHVIYRLRGPGNNFPENLRRPEPSLMLLGKWLIYSDSTKFLEKAALAEAGNLPRLIDLPEYELVAGELGGKLDGEKPFLLSYIDGSEGIRLMYDMTKSEGNRQAIRRAGENNIVAKKFSELLENNELPPFSEFEKYFAPTGMFGYDEPDGIHFGFFTLRAEPTDK